MAGDFNAVLSLGKTPPANSSPKDGLLTFFVKSWKTSIPSTWLSGLGKCNILGTDNTIMKYPLVWISFSSFFLS
jgi:hypothetical protein